MGTPRAAPWMEAGFGVALVLAVMVLGALGTTPHAVVRALQVTARWSFVLFWLAYAAGPLATLFGRRFHKLAARGRVFGLGYAAAHLIHLGLVAWLYRISAHPPVTQGNLIFFLVAVFWTYLLAALSIPGWAQAIGRRGFAALRMIGMNYIMLAFAADFFGPLRAGVTHYGIGVWLGYAPFMALVVAAVALRMLAAIKRSAARLVTPPGDHATRRARPATGA